MVSELDPIDPLGLGYGESLGNSKLAQESFFLVKILPMIETRNSTSKLNFEKLQKTWKIQAMAACYQNRLLVRPYTSLPACSKLKNALGSYGNTLKFKSYSKDSAEYNMSCYSSIPDLLHRA